MRTPPLVPVTLLAMLVGCTTDEVSESWQIDRLRILAVAAEPAEPRPGDFVTFTSLTVSPAVPWASTVWLACLDGADCGFDTTALEEELDEAAFEELLEAGLIGFEPDFPPTWTVPDDALDGLDDDEALEGVQAMINLAAIPDQAEIGPEDLEIAYKRIPVSLAPTPNHNPALVEVQVDGVTIPAGTRVTLDRGQTYELTPVFADDAVESYTYRTEDGVDESRTEEPYLTWYLQEGTFDQSYSVWPYFDRKYTAPDEPTLDDASIWIVARDRRGGMGWIELPVSVR